MADLVVGSAQTKAHADTKANIDNHLRFVRAAARHGVRLLAFPEMSLTGYDRENARARAFWTDDKRLQPLQEAANQYGMVIVAGAPIEIESRLYIGSFALQPRTRPRIYVKQFLHEGETDYFESRTDFNPRISLGNRKVGLAICADIDHPEHPEQAARDKCDLYLASIFFTAKSIDGAHGVLSRYAEKNKFMIVMSNYGGWCWNLEAGGKSGIWTEDGTAVTTSPDADECIVVASEHGGKWAGQVVRAD